MATSETRYSIVKLNNTNYFAWKFKMQLLLTKEGSWHCTTEDPPADTETAKYAEWLKRDASGYSSIGLNVEDEQLTHIRTTKTTKEAWEALRKYHERSTANSKVRLMKQVMRMRLEEGGNMEQHIGQINDAFQQMTDLGFDMKPEDWKAATLIGSLPESYDNLIAAFETRPEADLTAAYVQSRLIDEYQKRNDKGLCERNAALHVGRPIAEIKCYGCHEKGHFMRDCPKKRSKRNKKGSSNKEKASANLVNESASHEFMFVLGSVKNGWVIDSGATSHIASDIHAFTELNEGHRDQNFYREWTICRCEGKRHMSI